jgi:hypothetical protein
MVPDSVKFVRNGWTSVKTVQPPSAGDFQILERDFRRTCIIFCAGATSAYSVSPEILTAATDGLLVRANNANGSVPIILTLAEHGDMVTRAWHMLMAIPGPITVICSGTNEL